MLNKGSFRLFSVLFIALKYHNKQMTLVFWVRTNTQAEYRRPEAKIVPRSRIKTHTNMLGYYNNSFFFTSLWLLSDLIILFQCFFLLWKQTIQKLFIVTPTVYDMTGYGEIRERENISNGVRGFFLELACFFFFLYSFALI